MHADHIEIFFTQKKDSHLGESHHVYPGTAEIHFYPASTDRLDWCRTQPAYKQHNRTTEVSFYTSNVKNKEIFCLAHFYSHKILITFVHFREVLFHVLIASSQWISHCMCIILSNVRLNDQKNVVLQ